MCGIAGILSEEGYRKEEVKRMLNKLIHRGPDEMAYWEDNKFSAGMRRLSINDIEGGSQPLFDSSGNLILFYNGEIYNYQKLKRELESDGIKFNSNCDGEVICHLYAKYGESFFSLLDGMFAISIWDKKKKVLLLARDFPGEKPLYYSRLERGGIAFSSEINSLKECNEIDKRLDSQSIWDMPTFLWIPEPNTIYKNIKALLPGQYLKISLSKSIEINSFALNIKKPIIEERFNENDKIQIVKETVKNAVKSRLLSDVPIGTFLSGGLDSSIVTCLTRKYISELKTFCIGFKDTYDPYHGNSDESIEASLFASELDVEHFNIQVDAKDFKNFLPELIKSAGQPYAVSSGLGILAVSKLASDLGIKVLLSGDGADEAFGGYSWYKVLGNIRKYKNLTNECFRFHDLNDSIESKEKRLSKYSPEKKAWSLHYYGSENEKKDIFCNDFSHASSLRHFENRIFDDPLDFLNHDRDFYFPNEMLSKVDRFTMANSIEGRAPFAAPSVQLLAKQLEWQDLYRNGTLKWILRKAFEDILPSHIIVRRKHGFNVPIDFWLKNQWKDLFEETFSKNSKLMQLGYIEKNSRSKALKLLNHPKKIAGHIIFCYVVLNIWLENHY